MARQPIVIRGVTYLLDHLEPFTIKVAGKTPDDGVCVLAVTFGHHTFSQAWTDTCHPDYKIDEDGEHRSFCPTRHHWSQGLRERIQGHVTGRAYLTRDRDGRLNHMFVSKLSPASPPYQIVFQVTKANAIKGVDGQLKILSAYENNRLQKLETFERIRFANLVSKITGKPTVNKK